MVQCAGAEDDEIEQPKVAGGCEQDLGGIGDRQPVDPALRTDRLMATLGRTHPMSLTDLSCVVAQKLRDVDARMTAVESTNRSGTTTLDAENCRS